jgi:hypothetical protein
MRPMRGELLKSKNKKNEFLTGLTGLTGLPPLPLSLQKWPFEGGLRPPEIVT